ncbi:MAG: DUF58 domain-containing protein [Actinomycetota bacterium]|nr:DUF58 domain-containing protein [Actinomycetota bacterium]
MSARSAAATRWAMRPASTVASTGPASAPPTAVAAKAAVLRRLELDLTRRLDGMVSGDYLTFAPGPGSEAAGARAYGPGDDARRIDWSLSARALAPHVRTTEADRELETVIVADRSASLDFGTAHREKREVVLAVVAAFGFLTVRSGNRLGVLIAGGEKLVRMPARAGTLGLMAALSTLYDTPRHDASPAAGSDLAAALGRLERTQPRRGQIVVVSDFLDGTDWARPLRRLALRHQVLAAQITDPRELELPAVGMLSVVDAETGQRLHVQTNSAAIRARYAEAATKRHDDIRRSIARAGAAHLALSTDRDWLIDIVRFVARRRTKRVPARARGLAAAAGRPRDATAPPLAGTPDGGGVA